MKKKWTVILFILQGVIYSLFFIFSFCSSIYSESGLGAANPETIIPTKQDSVPVSDQMTDPAAADLTEETTSNLSENDINRFTNAIVLIKDFYVQPINDQHILDSAIRGIINGLDPHSEYLDTAAYNTLMTSTNGAFGGIGIEVSPEYGILKIISPLDDTPAAKAGIRAGDYIVAINHVLVSELALQDAITAMRGRAGSAIELTILRKGHKTPLIFKLQRQVIHVASIKGKMLNDQFAYIRISQFQEFTAKLLQNTINGLKVKNNGSLRGLILDLRNNPGGLLETAAQVVNTFLDEKQATSKYHKRIVYTEGRLPETNYQVYISGKDMLAGAPMIVLINGGSASASEIVAGALQDYSRALIVGTPSFGKGSVQTVIPLDKLHAIKLTTALYHTPAGRTIQNIGIIPDVQVDNLTVAAQQKEDDLAMLAPIKEFQLKNHLKNTQQATPSTSLAVDYTDLPLAQQDFQLFEAIKILRALSLQSRH